MTAKRETTGAAAKLVMTADRREISADGEDVAMFAVEVQDAQGRVVPITDNEVTFKVSGAGKLIGVGNGDPTDQESDKGTSRKAFSGCAWRLCSQRRQPGTSRWRRRLRDWRQRGHDCGKRSDATSAGGGMGARGAGGSGVTGLWRPVPSADGDSGILALLTGAGSTVFTLRQEGAA